MRITKAIPVIEGMTRERFEAEIRPAEQPVVLRGLIAGWPAVVAAKQSDEAVAAYFRALDQGRQTPVSLAPPAEQGRFFFTPDMKGYNFSVFHKTPGEVMDWLLAHRDDPDAVTAYAQSLVLAEHMPAFEGQNPMPVLAQSYGPRLWIGNRVRTQTHFDPSYNLACLVAGRRRFTLFPPEQIVNLYPGPFDLAPGGVPVSMASLEEPDFTAHPRFREALETAQFAELEPGDALFIPYAWWHHVQSLAAFNLLVNYWWNEGSSDNAPMPHGVLYMALISIRDLPPSARAVWRRILDMYVFGDGEAAVAHLPKHGRGIFGDITGEVIDRVRAYFKASLKL